MNVSFYNNLQIIYCKLLGLYYFQILKNSDQNTTIIFLLCIVFSGIKNARCVSCSGIFLQRMKSLVCIRGVHIQIRIYQHIVIHQLLLVSFCVQRCCVLICMYQLQLFILSFVDKIILCILKICVLCIDFIMYSQNMYFVYFFTLKLLRYVLNFVLSHYQLQLFILSFVNKIILCILKICVLCIFFTLKLLRYV
eukprot:TRINITY_DN12239_c1_g2_i3.p1 TRINITY_DN12239_c1_g2~~TRINITY_DN12239_c1_g2_i3.p1  ORF type:complete len:194 (-),score=-42.09 TRINITY_DN12239_c1_g2_i3:225-806(-)